MNLVALAKMLGQYNFFMVMIQLCDIVLLQHKTIKIKKKTDKKKRNSKKGLGNTIKQAWKFLDQVMQKIVKITKKRKLIRRKKIKRKKKTKR